MPASTTSSSDEPAPDVSAVIERPGEKSITANPADDTLSQRRVLRRRSTVISSFILAGLLIVVAGFLTPDEFGHGFFSVLAAFAGVLPLIVLALTVGAWPHVIIDADRMEVHNTFFWYAIPYPSINDIRQIRMGLIIKSHGGRTIPVTAYASGSAGRMLGHHDAAGLVIRAVEEKTEFFKSKPGDRTPAPVRHVERRNLVVVLVSVVIAIGVIYGAAQTYH